MLLICVVAEPRAALKVVPPPARRPTVRESTKVESGLTERLDALVLPLESSKVRLLGELMVALFASLTKLPPVTVILIGPL